MLASAGCNKDVAAPDLETRQAITDAVLADAGGQFPRGTALPPIKNLRCISDTDCEVVMVREPCCSGGAAVAVSWRDPETAARVRAQRAGPLNCDSICFSGVEFRSPCIQNVCQLQARSHVRNPHRGWLVNTHWQSTEPGVPPDLSLAKIVEVDDGAPDAASEEPTSVSQDAGIAYVRMLGLWFDSKDVSREALADLLRAREPVIRSCYERELQRSPSLMGRIVLRFTITTEGSTSDVEMSDMSLEEHSERFDSCIRFAMRGWTFPLRPKSAVRVKGAQFGMAWEPARPPTRVTIP